MWSIQDLDAHASYLPFILMKALKARITYSFSFHFTCLP